MKIIRVLNLFTLIFFMIFGFNRAQAMAAGTVIPVDTYLDDVDTNQNCTLREAIMAAHSDSPRDACPAGTGADTIQLPAGTYSLSLPGSLEDGGLQGDLDLASDMTIQGVGMHQTIIDAGSIDRVFQVFSPAQVTFSALTVRNGNTGTGLGPSYSGGGIALISGSSVVLEDVSVSANNAGSDGGGVYNNGGTLTMNRVQVVENMAEYAAGVRNSGSLTMTDATITGNHATKAGGGIYNTGSLSLDRVTISGNIADTNGGGLYLHSSDPALGLVTIQNATISGNQAKSWMGGGVWIYYQTEMWMTNSTVAGNSAGQGGGFFNYHQQGALDPISDATINAVGNIHLLNTLVANNTGANCARSDQTEPIDSLGHNLDSGTTCEFNPALGDLEGTDPQLGPLQNNGGYTQTHAIVIGSPALDVGDNSGCPAVDQRGKPRPYNVICDIGAYEFSGWEIMIPIILNSP